jgi:hypothetical protein
MEDETERHALLSHGALDDRRVRLAARLGDEGASAALGLPCRPEPSFRVAAELPDDVLRGFACELADELLSHWPRFAPEVSHHYGARYQRDDDPRWCVEVGRRFSSGRATLEDLAAADRNLPALDSESHPSGRRWRSGEQPSETAVALVNAAATCVCPPGSEGIRAALVTASAARVLLEVGERDRVQHLERRPAEEARLARELAHRLLVPRAP